MIKRIVPYLFSQFDHRPYPKDNFPDFENWFKDNYAGECERIYLPVMWTAYYKAADFGNNRPKIRALQTFLSNLDTSKKYFTICQFDDGIINSVRHLDIKVFSMSGLPMDYPLPLICQPHKFSFNLPRCFEANFIGSNTHPLREQVLKIQRKGWFIDSTHHPLEFYCRTLASSYFTLCPRGYGPTSFRIMEALQYGSIPVYISDKHVIPHNMPFDYGVLVTGGDITELWELLFLADVDALQARGREVYERYFTFQSNKQLIIKNADL